MTTHRLQEIDLFDTMEQGGWVITPNNRLSSQLLHDYFKRRGLTILDKPHCMPYQSFLHNRFNRIRHQAPYASHPVLINSYQQRYVWQTILNANEGFLNEIQDAWKRCQQWQIDTCHEAFAQTPQTQQFQTWRIQFEDRLNTLGLITDEQLPNYLLNFPDVLTLPRVIWACFDDFTPQQRAIQACIQARGGEQIYYDLSDKASVSHAYAAKDNHDEYLQLIHWLQCKLDANEKRIGVVIPDLQQQSHSLQRFLQRYIPASQFNISLGQALSDYSLVAHALAWLELGSDIISNACTQILLHSPYIGGAKQELLARSQFLQEHPLLKEETLLFNQLLTALKTATPALAQRLEQIIDYPEKAPVVEWIHLFKSRLTQLGFPGDYPLNSATYQCFERLMTLFDDYLQLAIITPVMRKEQALQALRSLATSTVFQPRISPCPIHILGLLEASGCTFDSVWVCGMTDQCLPQKINLSAFIPIDLQRAQQMPHALPERELQFAQQLVQRLQHGCQETVFSYPRWMGDTPYLPSPVIRTLPRRDAIALEQPVRPAALILLQESYQQPLHGAEVVTGGTALLANQAKCPFRAFAAHRLHARKGLTVSTGMDAAERGQLIHAVMDKLWVQLADQATLLAIETTALDQLIARIINDALQPIIQNRACSFTPLAQTVELIRLKRLIHAALQWDSQRAAFTVESVEKTFTYTLSNISFRVRVDRIDRIEGGNKWVIDYKSTLPTSTPWKEERPEEPQLLLYALLDEAINGLLFLQLKAGRIQCKGLSEEKVAVKGMNTLLQDQQWQAHQIHWHHQLNALAREVHTGYCPPIPTHETTCARCDFKQLCRI